MKRSAARASRAVAAVVLGASFALATLGPAAAVPDPGTVTPFVDCVSSAPGPAPDAFTVVFGYRNTSTTPVSLAPGAAQNTFSLHADRGQPATFDPGEHHAAFATTFAGTAGDLTWTLGTATAAIDAATTSCAAATTITLSVPSSAEADDALDVTATVGRMLGAAPGAGSVEFRVDASIAATTPVDEQGVARANLDLPAGAHTITARYVPPTATPQLLGSMATASVTVSRASAISITSAGLSADGRSARFTVSRTASDTTARVDYVTADGSASAGSDYASSRGTVRFAVGQTSATVAIPLLNRPFGSSRASFYVLLQRASETVDIAGATAVLPPVTAVVAQRPAQAFTPPGFVQLPPVPPVPPAAAAAPATDGAPSGNGAGDLALMFGGLVLTAGAAFAVVGIMRSRSTEAP